MVKNKGHIQKIPKTSAVAKHPNWALSPKGVFDLKGGAIGFEDFPP
jgi:hypothetical protein